MERATVRPGRLAGGQVALQLSEVALETRAPLMTARRDADDRRVRDLWCRLKRRAVR